MSKRIAPPAPGLFMDRALQEMSAQGRDPLAVAKERAQSLGGEGGMPEEFWTRLNKEVDDKLVAALKGRFSEVRVESVASQSVRRSTYVYKKPIYDLVVVILPRWNEVMGLAEKLHGKVFQAMHGEHVDLADNDPEILARLQQERLDLLRRQEQRRVVAWHLEDFASSQ